MQTWSTLPGFRTYRDFFSELKGRPFTPVSPSAKRQRRYIESILDIHGEPEEATRDIVGDWYEHAEVMDVREYEEFDYVRIVVESLGPEGNWAEHINLMMTFSGKARDSLRTYTFIYKRGRLEEGITAYLRGTGLWGSSDADALEYLRIMDETVPHNTKLSVWCKTRLSIINASRGSEYVRVVPAGFGKYTFEWFSHDWPYSFFYDNNGVGFSACDAEPFVRAFCEKGLLGVQDMYNWKHLDAHEIMRRYRSRDACAREKIRAERRKTPRGEQNAERR